MIEFNNYKIDLRCKTYVLFLSFITLQIGVVHLILGKRKKKTKRKKPTKHFQNAGDTCRRQIWARVWNRFGVHLSCTFVTELLKAGRVADGYVGGRRIDPGNSWTETGDGWGDKSLSEISKSVLTSSTSSFTAALY